jgi:mono/diheme cytochrome c family protein
MSNRIWGLTVVALVALGLSACGGDASAEGNGEADAAPAQVVAADATDMEATPQELPEGVTAAMVEEGKGIYGGAGICMSCHGATGEGIPSLGADLTDDEWLHVDGSYESIVSNIMKGVTAQESSSGVPMPAKGGTAITDDQVKAVAAYVWTLSK